MKSAGPFRSRSQARVLLKSTWRPALKLLVHGTLIAGVVLSFAMMCIGVLANPLPFTGAIVAGMLVRLTGQWWHVRQVFRSRKPFPFAEFHFQEGEIRCELREQRARKYVTSLPWRCAASLLAGTVCWTAQRLSLFPLHLPVQAGWRMHADLLTLSHWSGWGLPLFAGALFLVWDGPAKRWTRQVHAALQARAELSRAEVLRDREIDGLDRAIENIHRQLGCHRSSSYRGAIEKRLSSRTEALVLDPQSVSALVEGLTEAARLEWAELSDGLARFHALESEIRALQSAASLLREPLVEYRADELLGQLKEAAGFVAHWGWKEFQQQLLQLQQDVDGASRRLRDRRAPAPFPSLAPGSDPYRLLGADPSASTASIRKLRLRLAQVYHPDIGGETCNAAKMAEVNAAYDAILLTRDGNSR